MARVLAGKGWHEMVMGRWGEICAMGGSGVVLYGRRGEEIAKLAYPEEFGGEIPTSCMARANGEIVCAVHGAGVWYIRNGGWVRETGLGALMGNAHLVRESAQGTLWVTDTRGVWLQRRDSEEWRHIPHKLGDTWGGDPVELAETGDGRVWVATSLGALFCYRESGRFEAVSHYGTPLDFRISGMLVDSTDQLWLSTPGLGLALVGPALVEEQRLELNKKAVLLL